MLLVECSSYLTGASVTCCEVEEDAFAVVDVEEDDDNTRVATGKLNPLALLLLLCCCDEAVLDPIGLNALDDEVVLLTDTTTGLELR